MINLAHLERVGDRDTIATDPGLFDRRILSPGPGRRQAVAPPVRP
jgi:hypothetical protein